MPRIIKATKKNDDCNCGKQVKKSERKKITYKKKIRKK